MNRTSNCAAVIPCFNEAATIGALVRVVRSFQLTVIVVDDGSTDGTANEAAGAGAAIVHHSRNCGKGAALQSGFEHARSRGFTWALTLDGDGQHHPADIPGLVTRAEESGAALVVGNRLVAAEALPWLRRRVNQWMSRQLSRFAGMPLPDSQCGLRLVNLEAWSGLRFRTQHFEFESELLIEFVRAGLQVEFVPVRVIYHSGHSHIRPIVDTWRWFRWWFGECAARGSWRLLLPAAFRLIFWPEAQFAFRTRALPAPLAIRPESPNGVAPPGETRA
jgi:glycosyltransferase involved in cell wall biosynthesis